MTIICIAIVALCVVCGQLTAKSLGAADDPLSNLIERHQHSKELHHLQRLHQFSDASSDAKRSAIAAIGHHSRLHGNHRKHHRAQHHQQQHQQKHPNQILNPTTASANCPRCKLHGLDGEAAAPSAALATDEELTRLRIAFAKNQILKKLRLTEVPNVRLSGVPRPVAEGATYRQPSDADGDGIPDESAAETMSIADEFYAKTNQKIIFSELGEFFVVVVVEKERQIIVDRQLSNY